MTPLAALYHQVTNNPEGVAFIDGDDRWTYARFAEQALRVARGLLDRSIRQGDRIVLDMPNRPELAVALYACFTSGRSRRPCISEAPTFVADPQLPCQRTVFRSGAGIRSSC